MALFTCKLKSSFLASTTTVRIYMPGDLPMWHGKQPRAVFTLLHGLTNDGDDWVNFSAALRYAADNNIALVIPDAANSFYCDMAAGPAYYQWLTLELPAMLSDMTNLPKEREKNFVCGLSMGGYGALMLGLTQPDRYAGCASFSGAVDMGMMIQAAKQDPSGTGKMLVPVFGEALELPENRNVFTLAKQTAMRPKAQQPQVLCTVGKQDMEPYYIYPQNQNLLQFVKAEAPNLDFTYMEWDGVHEWNFWDRSLVYTIDQFVNKGYAEAKHGDWAAQCNVETTKGE